MTTNAEPQEWLKQWPDDEKVHIHVGIENDSGDQQLSEHIDLEVSENVTKQKYASAPGIYLSHEVCMWIDI